jgi:hypothetical protein
MIITVSDGWCVSARIGRSVLLAVEAPISATIKPETKAGR